MDTEITMMMAVLIAKRKPVNQLSESSEKEYKGVWGGVEGRKVGGDYIATTYRVEDVLARW